MSGTVMPITQARALGPESNLIPFSPQAGVLTTEPSWRGLVLCIIKGHMVEENQHQPVSSLEDPHKPKADRNEKDRESRVRRLRGTGENSKRTETNTKNQIGKVS